MSKITINIDYDDQKKTDKYICIGNDPIDYVQVFDMACSGWERDHEYNLAYLRMTQRHLNDKLRQRGYLFLNEAYEILGLPPTKIGQLTGWINDENKCIDLGFNSQVNVRFMNGDSNTFVIEPNVDGFILHRL